MAAIALPSGPRPNSIVLQFAAGTFLILSTPVRSTLGFVKKVAETAKRKGILIITNPDLMPKKLAERLVEKYGESLAPSLHQLQTILPFSRAQMFTEGWQYLYQAHHILEKKMAEKVLGITSFDDLPAIILKDAEHKAMTKKLKEAQAAWMKLNRKGELTPEGLWETYQLVYADKSTWLVAIAPYFGK